MKTMEVPNDVGKYTLHLICNLLYTYKLKNYYVICFYQDLTYIRLSCIIYIKIAIYDTIFLENDLMEL